MNDKELRAAAAKRLRDDDVFQSVIASIREDQVNVFLNVSASQEDREQAHGMIRALSSVEAELNRRINYKLDKKG